MRRPARGRPPEGRIGGGRALLLLALGGLLLSAGGCGGDPPVVVGSKYFTEQDILGELVATWIERTTDVPVRRRLHLGGSFICHRALVEGDLDLYVEYTGTALTAILERPPGSDPDSVFRTVARTYRERFDLVWTEPLGFENTFAVLVRRSTADSLGIRTISEAVPHARTWVPGMGYEFVERADGLPGLVEAYGLEFATEPRTMELGLMYPALANGQVDVIAGNSTDGQIEALDLFMLRDDRGYFPPYEAVPVVRADALRRYPELEGALRRLAGRIDTREMRRMNRAVDAGDRDFRRVAHEWVRRELGERSGS